MRPPETFAAVNTQPRAEFLPDGRVVVRDVPFFSELRKTDPSVAAGLRQERGREWLQRALDLDLARERDGHFAPMNLRHTFDATPPKKVGVRALRSIKKLRVNPQDPDERDTIFGDEIFDSAAAFDEARDHEHRSPEISPDWPDEIGPLALLREASPFNKYPNVKAAPPALVAAAEAFEARGGRVEQAWSRGSLFAAQNPYAIANAMLSRGEITKAKFDRVVAAIDADEKSETTKEADGMAEPATKDKKPEGKTLSADERMEAMFSKFQEACMSKFAEMVDALHGKKHDEPDGDEKAEELKGPDVAKKPEAASVSTPELSLPPAVSQAKPGESFAALEQMARTQGQKIVQLEAALSKASREREAEHFAAEAENTLAASGVPVTESVRKFLRAEAFEGGKTSVARFVEREVTLHKERSALAPSFDAYGALGAHASAQGDGRPAELVTALETFGTSPQKKALVMELFSSWHAQDRLFKQVVPFHGVCHDDPVLNPASLGDRGGLPQKGAR